MRVAIVHDWLVTLGGGELVLRELLRLYPGATVFTLFDKMPRPQREFIGLGETRTTLLDRLPGIATSYRRLLPLFPAAIESLDLAGFDLVISNSHAVAKGVRTRPGQLHVSYCLSPMRYAWDLRDQYLRESRLDTGVRGFLAHRTLDRMQRWDRARSDDVRAFATLSEYIADRMRRAYGRTAEVVYPPVDVEFFQPSIGLTRGDYYVTASRFVPYKRIDLITRAFARMPDRRLIVAGTGPELQKIRAASGNNVTLAGHVDRNELRTLLHGARAFVFAAEEDFGIAPLEAQACGIPVVAFDRGGVRETVQGLDSPQPTGVFFGEQTEDAIVAAVRQFESVSGDLDAADCRRNAERFSETAFRTRFSGFVGAQWQAFTSHQLAS